MNVKRATAIAKRAAIRGIGAAVLLFVALEGLILAGKTTKIDAGEALVIAAMSGAVYAALWSIFAIASARMLTKIENAAKGDKP